MRATIAAVESTISLPKGAARLHEYARYYSEGVGASTRLLGVYILNGSNDVHIVPFEELPKVLDGGCSVIRLEYDIETKQVIYISCNGVA